MQLNRRRGWADVQPRLHGSTAAGPGRAEGLRQTRRPPGGALQRRWCARLVRSGSPDCESGTDLSTSELEADIERTREELGQTVEALSQKFDVKAQARLKMEKVRGKHKAVALAGGVLVVALGTVGAVLMWGRRR